MLTTRSTVIARAGTWKRFSTPSSLIVMPALEIPYKRPAAVGGRRVHRQNQAREDENEHDAREPAPDEVVEERYVELALRTRLVQGVDADRAADRHRQEDVDEQREGRRRAQTRAPCRASCRGTRGRSSPPTSIPYADQAFRNSQTNAICQPPHGPPTVQWRFELCQSPRKNGMKINTKSGIIRSAAGDVAEPERRLDTEDVEEPDPDDQPDRDQVRRADVVVADREVDVTRRAGEPLRHDDVADRSSRRSRGRPTSRSSSRRSQPARRARSSAASPRARTARSRPTARGTSPRSPSRSSSGAARSRPRCPTGPSRPTRRACRTRSPTNPIRKPGLQSAITKPSYQRSDLSSCRSSMAASATAYLLITVDVRRAGTAART